MQNRIKVGALPMIEDEVKPPRSFSQRRGGRASLPGKDNGAPGKMAEKDFFFNDLQEILILVDQQLELSFVNPAWEECTGYSPDESLHRDLFYFFRGTTGKTLARAVSGLLRGDKEDFSGKGLVILCKSGETRTLNYHFIKYTTGSETHAAGFLSEVTGVRELEEMLSNQRYAAEMKTALIHMVSHELRTPFAVIQSSAEILGMMQQQRQSPDAQAISSHASNILQEISHVTEILNRMVMFSRIESGMLPGTAEPIDIESFVMKLLVSGFAPWKDGRSVKMVTSGVPRIARIDSVMLGLVLRNLLDNALKYSAGKRPPIVRLRFLQSRWSITVRDYGIGIPAGDLERLFRPFSRASNVGALPGMGLGLMIVDYIVKSYHGTLRVKSKEGQGTTFTVHFLY